MGIRESLNKSPVLTTGVTVGIIVIALVIILVQLTGSSDVASGGSKLYFIEDGKTAFEDCFTADAQSIPPIDHNGKKAVIAHVFQGPDKKRFVGYVEKFSDEAKAMIERNKGLPPEKRERLNPMIVQPLVRRPAGTDREWVPRMMSEYSSPVMDVKTPDGKPAEEVLP